MLEIELETFQPRWSPDGKEVAYLRGAHRRLKVLDLESGKSRHHPAGRPQLLLRRRRPVVRVVARRQVVPGQLPEPDAVVHRGRPGGRRRARARSSTCRAAATRTSDRGGLPAARSCTGSATVTATASRRVGRPTATSTRPFSPGRPGTDSTSSESEVELYDEQNKKEEDSDDDGTTTATTTARTRRRKRATGTRRTRRTRRQRTRSRSPIRSSSSSTTSRNARGG